MASAKRGTTAQSGKSGQARKGAAGTATRSRARTSGKKDAAPLRFPATGKLKSQWERVVQIAVDTLPDVVEHRSYGTPALKASGKLLARLRSEDEGGLALWCDQLDRAMLMQADSDAFYITDHYANANMVLINLELVRWDAMPGLLEQAWRMVAPAKAIAAFDAERPGG